MSRVFEHKIRVRYAECDSMGFVHHSIYVLYFEEARTEIMRKLGVPYSKIEADGYIMPVRKMDFLFLQAGRYDDLLTIRVTIHVPKGIRFHFSYETYNEKNILLNTGNMELFFAKKENLKPSLLPKFWLDLLNNHLQS